MTARRRSRRRPLTEFARRSPVHAIGVWLLRSALVALLFTAVWLLVMNWAAPSMLVDQARDPREKSESHP